MRTENPGGRVGLWRGVCALLLMVLSVVAAAGEKAAVVAFSSGAAQIVDVQGQPRPAARGADLFSGEAVDTRDGMVQLNFRDGATLSLRPGTRFRIDDYAYAGQGGQAAAGDRGFFSLIKGGFRTVTGWLGKGSDDQYRVSTVVATIGIRGTQYSAALDDAGLTVTTQAGLVVVCNDGGCLEVRPGESSFARNRAEKPRLQPSGAISGRGEALPSVQRPTMAGSAPPSFTASPASPGQVPGVTSAAGPTGSVTGGAVATSPGASNPGVAGATMTSPGMTSPGMTSPTGQ